MRRLFAVTAMTILVLLNAGRAEAHHGSIKICNESGEELEITFMFRNRLRFWDENWSSTGWYIVPDNECSTVIDGFGAAFEAYVGVAEEGLRGRRQPAIFSWSTNYRFGYESDNRYCVSEDNFRRENIPLSSHTVCPEGYEIFPFLVYLNHNSEANKEFRILTIE